MHDHPLVKKVASNTQARSSSGSSNEIHSCRSSGNELVTGARVVGGQTVAVNVTDERALVADLRAALGDGGVHAEPTTLALYGRDASIVTSGAAAAVCFPTS